MRLRVSSNHPLILPSLLVDWNGRILTKRLSLPIQFKPFIEFLLVWDRRQLDCLLLPFYGLGELSRLRIGRSHGVQISESVRSLQTDERPSELQSPLSISSLSQGAGSQ